MKFKNVEKLELNMIFIIRRNGNCIAEFRVKVIFKKTVWMFLWLGIC